MKNFYVYYSYEEWGRGYIGKRECYCLPEEDVKYFGSFRDKTFKPTQKIILATFNTREEALAAEIALHGFYEIEKNPHFANKARQTSTGFYSGPTGHKKSEEECQAISFRMRKENLREETLVKRSESLRKFYSDPEAKKISSERATEIGARPETKLKRSIAAKRTGCDLEIVAKRREAQRKTFSTEESAIRRKEAAIRREAKKRAERLLTGKKGGVWDEQGNLLFPPPSKVNELRVCDPDHPELGIRSPGTLVRMQKSRGYPHGKENRVKVTNDESRSS
jgi:hypothetical protein